LKTKPISFPKQPIKKKKKKIEKKKIEKINIQNQFQNRNQKQTNKKKIIPKP
jgi:hypothetical protein